MRPSEALAHCGECHTPRNAAFALDNRKKFSGALAAGWHAFNITSDKSTGVGSWSDDELFAYLAKGHAEGRGTAAGPMGEAVDASFSLMAPADIRALAAWRGAPAPNSCVVCGVLQSGPHTPGITERCANCIDRSNGLAPLSPFPF